MIHLKLPNVESLKCLSRMQISVVVTLLHTIEVTLCCKEGSCFHKRKTTVSMECVRNQELDVFLMLYSDDKSWV